MLLFGVCNRLFMSIAKRMRQTLYSCTLCCLQFFELHPALPDVKTLFDDGDLSIAANVGTLVVPTKASTFGTVALPPQLFSHSDQQNQWQSSLPDKPFQSGWCGRIADILHPQNTGSEISMSVSLSGINDIQAGLTQVSPQYSITNAGAVTLNGYGNRYSSALSNSRDKNSYKGNSSARRLKAFQDIMDYTHAHLFEESYNNVVRQARENEGYVDAALEEALNGAGQPSVVQLHGGELRLYAPFDPNAAEATLTPISSEPSSKRRAAAVDRLRMIVTRLDHGLSSRCVLR